MPGFLKLSCLKQLYLSNKTDRFSYKGGFGVGVYIKVFNRNNGLGYK